MNDIHIINYFVDAGMNSTEKPTYPNNSNNFQQDLLDRAYEEGIEIKQILSVHPHRFIPLGIDHDHPILKRMQKIYDWNSDV